MPIRMTAVITTGLIFALSHPALAAAGHPACPSGQHWVKAHHRNAYVRVDGASVSAANVRAHCQTNPPSYAVWADRLKDGMPPRWGKKGEKSKTWTENERERVLEALAAMPDTLLGVPPQNIYRLLKSIPDAENPGSGHANDIALYDPAFASDQNLRRVLAHELAHKLYGQFTESDALEYNAAAGWLVRRTPNGTRVFIPRAGGFVDEDGEEGPNEDYSNNIEYYLFNPNALHEKTPKVYDWIRRRYGVGFKVRGR